MPNITLSITKELKEKMDLFPEINWSQTTRRLIEDKIDRLNLLEKFDKMFENSEVTDKDISEMIRKSRKNRFKELKI